MSEAKPKRKSKEESLDSLTNQLYQAKMEGNTLLVRKIEAIIKAIKNKK